MRTRLLVVLAVLVLGATGCSGSTPKSPASAAPRRVKILDEAELNQTLLTEQQVGTHFVTERLGWSINANGWPGCLASVNGITWFSAPTREALVGFHPDDAIVFPVVISTAASFGTEKEAAAALPALRSKLAGCDRVAETDEDTRFALRVSRNDRETAGPVDDQVNVSASGTMRAPAGTVPLAMSFSVVRVDNNVLLTGFLTVGRASVTDQATEVTEAALARLAAVVAGKTVPDTSLGFEPYDPNGGGGTPA